MSEEWVEDLFIDYEPMDQAIVDICRDNDMKLLAGGSGKGWSRYKMLQQCPDAFYLAHVRKSKDGPVVKEQSRPALDLGSAAHGFLALRYLGMMGQATIDAEALMHQLLNRRVNPQALSEAWRIFNAYEARYDEDYLIPLAVEEHVEHLQLGFTARYDTVARIDDPPPLYTPGIYVVEHKTAAKFDETTLDSWDLDGEILGEMALWHHGGMDKKYGPLAGLIVNILGKQKVPQFQRTLVAVSSVHTARHMRNLQYWSAQEAIYRKHKRWPQAMNGCVSRYGRCQYYDHCRNLGA